MSLTSNALGARNAMPPTYKYFSAQEAQGLDPTLMAMLDLARGKAGIPFRITCGLRTLVQNEGVGGVGDSSHLRGLAVDLACANSLDRYKMVSALLSVGFTRLGIYDAHCHVDCDPTLPPNVIWIGLSH